MIIIPTEKRFDWRYRPTVLFSIVLVNVLVFFFYQANDDQKLEQALALYSQHNYLELEWPLIQQYLEAREEFSALDDLRDMHDDDALPSLAVHIMLRSDFYRHLRADPYNFIGYQRAENWLTHRATIDQYVQSLSFNAHGLIPKELNAGSLLTHQFLHGDIMHLLGNLFFLIICGFAVEAAIGHWRFLAFYLVAGVTGGLAHALVDLSSSTTLVGASGAISGVMAMYLAVFRFKRIEFFYWFFVVVGYLRAPALIVLPIYIGKELTSFYTDTDSNVAFMAHAGGFLAGALLMLGNYFISPKTIDTDYVENDQSIDPLQEALAKIYAHIEQFRFDAARKQIDAAIAEFGVNHRLAQLRLNLTKLNGGAEHRQSLALLLALEPEQPGQLRQQADWVQSQPAVLSLLEPDVRYRLAVRLTQLQDLSAAEAMYQNLQADTPPHPSLDVLAKKLALAFRKHHKPTKAKKYEALASAWEGI